MTCLQIKIDAIFDPTNFFALLYKQYNRGCVFIYNTFIE